MPRKMPSKVQPDEYDSEDFDETETMISRNKTVRAKSALGFSTKKNSKKTKKRPVTPGRARAQSAQGFRSGKDLWMNAIKKKQTLMHANGRHGESPRHKTPIDFWVETLRKTGTGISTESSRMNTFSGLKNGNEKFYPYLSTSHYMRTAMGTEKQGRYDDPTVKPSPGRPAYKTPEEYYDEVLELRKQISAMNHDSSTMKTKIRRLEEDNLKKEKEMESLLNPGKSEEIRRTIGDRKPDSGAVIHSLKQKILKLEVQLRDRESAYNKLQAELKVTKVEEMKVQMEALYQEIVRLQNIKSASSTKVGSENSVRVKALNETILRLSRSNEALQQENRSLKEDLEKAIEGSNLKPDLDRDYDDMNRRELLMTISNLEKRVNKGERYETDSTGSLDKDVSRSKLVLKGSLEERLSQLDHRETELLDEVQRLKLTIKRLREERSSRKLDERESLPPTPTPRRRASRDVGSAGSSRRPSSASRPYSARRDSMMSEDRAQNVNEFKQRHAATSIQRQWRNRKQQQEQDEKVQHFRENRAAKKIQNEWIGYQHRKHDGDVDDAAYTIQAALNGHRSRKKQLRHLADDDSSTATEDDDDVFLIQSSLKGHHARVEQMKRLRSQRYDSYEDEDEYYDTKSSGQSRRSSVQRPSSGKGQRRKASTPSVHRFKPKYGSGLIGETNGDDDDEDIMF
ncbi:IQ domain-containing protein E-like isoform X2 [Littorina saxatilis]|uniref:IQ domain-containing protein E-like n=2 Tax=Littorina saxatilis TaxID=31220 RepID=A0AAN9BVG4_9CAEN